MKFCPNCGEKFKDGAKFCDKCGTKIGEQAKDNANGAEQKTNVNTSTVNTSTQPKSKLAAGLLQIFLGCFGVGRFYLGYTGIGVAQLLVSLCTCGIGAIWPFIDGILILVGSVNVDADGNPLGE